jgi:hypothetical protein
MNSDETDNFTIRNYQPGDETDVISLWRECELVVPWNNPLTDIARKTADSPHLFFIGTAIAAGSIFWPCARRIGTRAWPPGWCATWKPN